MIPIVVVAAKDDLYGASRAVLGQLRHLPEHGLFPHLLTPKSGPLSQAAKNFGVPTFASSIIGRPRSLAARFLPSAYGEAQRWLNSAAPRLLVASTLSAAPAVARLSQGRPWVLHLRNLYAEDRRSKHFEKFQAQAAPWVLAVSQAVLEQFRPLASERQRLLVAPDGIEPVSPLSRAEARARLGLDATEKVAGIIGAVSPSKRTLFAAEVIARCPGWRLGVLGDGHDAYAQEVRRHPQVCWLGFRPEAAGLLAAFDVVLHPRADEAFGLAPVEAQHAGVPVLASRAAGLLESLGDGALWLQPQDAEAWVQAVCGLTSVSVADLIARGRANAQKHTAAFATKNVASIYRQVLEHP